MNASIEGRRPLISIEVGLGVLEEPLYIIMESLESEPVVVWDSIDRIGLPTGTRFPYHTAYDFYPKLFEKAKSQLLRELNDKRKDVYPPVELVDGLIEIPAQSIPGSTYSADDIIIRADDATDLENRVTYTPYLRWIYSDTYDHKESIHDYSHGCWFLYLMGVEGHLDTAQWDDREGIKNLAESMFDVESLQVLLGMLRPDDAQFLTALEGFRATLETCKQWDYAVAREIFDKSEVLQFSEVPNTLAPPHIYIQDLQLDHVTIAWGIETPDNPRFKGGHDAEERKFLLDNDSGLMNKSYLRRFWRETFMKEAEALGWRFVDVGNVHDGFTNPNTAQNWWTIWFTKLSETEWEKAKPLFSRVVIRPLGLRIPPQDS